MSLRDLSRRHLLLIGLYSTRYAIRGGAGILYLLLVLAVGLIVATVAMLPLEQAERDVRAKRDRAAAVERVFLGHVEDAVPLVSAVLGERAWSDLAAPPDPGRDRWARWLLLEKPTLLSLVLFILVYALPLLSVVGGFNQYAGDVATKGIRFQLLRTERANIYFGRFLGSVAYAAGTLALLLATIVVYFGLRVDLHSWGDLLAWGARGLLILVVLSLPYLALAGLISAAVDSPFGALVMAELPVIAVPAVALLAGLKWEWAVHVKWALPWGCQGWLLHPDLWRVGVAALACLGYTAVFLALGYRHFSRRDL